MEQGGHDQLRALLRVSGGGGKRFEGLLVWPMRADQDGQSLNPRAASQMQQRPHGPAGDVSSGLFVRKG
ncbi:unnamed protein product [Tetraodon nigroviridis]|uniref:(spotted green pufferfish) hypothetical protein n=1 Tax=Tetraodon nigroviridis TaxID=99883 RepID=Q4SCR3_TETNG|nr:unnamed protein product [Tetraodon nigroviridis]